MAKIIDCLLIGNYELSIDEQIVLERINGSRDSIKSRDLNLAFVKYNNRYYTPSELFNKIFYDESGNKDDIGYIRMDNIVSNTITYLYNYLAKRGYCVDYINEFKSHMSELSQKLSKDKVRCIAISTTLIVDPYPIAEMVKFIRKYDSNVKIILGGPLILTVAATTGKAELQEYLKGLGADIYVNSPEGEAALGEIVHSLVNNQEINQIKNIYYWDGTEYKFTSSSPESNSFEEDLINWKSFSDKKIDLVNVRTSKSCMFSCAFCTYPILAGSFKVAEIDLVEKMLNDINDLGSVSYITFIDDTLNVPVERFKEMLRMFIKNKYKFKWSAFFRCQYADREIIEMMKESGCESVFLGIESGSQEMLDRLNKKVKLEQYYKGLSLLNEYNIHSFASFIIGFPGETYETFQETKKFIEEAKPTFYTAHNWIYVLLAPINRQKEKFNLHGMNDEWSHSTMNSKIASELVYELFLSVNNSIFVRSSLESSLMLHFLKRGLTLEQVKQFLTYYNVALKDKILNPKNKGISQEIAEKLRAVCMKQTQ